VRLAALLAALLAPTAAATDVTLKKGDVMVVRGTNLLCLFDRDSKTRKLEVGCIVTGSKGPLANSWGTGMFVNGTVEVVQFDAKGSSSKTRFRRPLGRAAPARTYRLKIGDHFRPAGTRIVCGVRPGQSTVVGCVYTPRRAQKTTHEFVISKLFAGALSVTLSTGKVETLYARKQPPS
jgi:hypothetical protein